MNNSTAFRYPCGRSARMESLEGRTLLAAAAGSLDATFGDQGIVRIADTQHLPTAVTASAMQPDGRAILAGTTTTPDGGSEGTLARLDAAGQPDATFGQGGLLTLADPGYYQFQVASVALDGAGNIVVAGRVAGPRRRSFAAVARVRPDGSMDTSFGTGGWVTVPFGRDAQVNAVAVEADGRILLGGADLRAQGTREVSNMTVARLNADGSVDASFGRRGYAVVPFTVGRHGPYGVATAADAIAVQPDGRIVVAGGGMEFAVARLRSSGAPDATFGVDGRVGLPGTPGQFSAMTIDPSGGEIYLAGGTPQPATVTSGRSDLAVAAVTPRGRFDDTFGGGGLVLQRFSTSRYHAAQANGAGIQLTGGGQLVVGGTVHSPYASGPLLERFNADGSLDQTFADHGSAVFAAAPTDAGNLSAAGLLATPSGQYVVPYVGAQAPAGSTSSSSLDVLAQLRAVRFNADGSADTSFGTSGVAAANGPLVPGNNDVSSLGVAPGGAFYLVARNETGAFIGGYTADGGVDATFGQGGRLPSPAIGSFDGVTVTPADGKLIALTNTFFATANLQRYDAAGNLDPTYGSGGTVSLTEQAGFGGEGSVELLGDGSVLAIEHASGDVADSVTTLFHVDAAGRIVGTTSQSAGVGGNGSSFGEVIGTPGGKVLAVISAGNHGTPAPDTLAQYNADLTPDTAFGSNGVLTLDGLTFDTVSSIAVAADGSIYLAGYTFANRNGPVTLVRLTSGGALDTSFGTGGFVGGLPAGTQLLVQDDGKLIAASASGSALALSRYNPDGSLDATFGSGGRSSVVLGWIQSGVIEGVELALQHVNGSEELLAAGSLVHSSPAGGTGIAPSDGFITRVEL